MTVTRGSGYVDASGDFVPSDPVPVLLDCPCRYERNGQARSVVLDDGSAFVYSFIVYKDVDPGCDIRHGDLIDLYDASGAHVGRHTVKEFHRGQLNEKIWL